MKKASINTDGLIVLAADVHGNKSQYDKIFAFAENQRCSALIFCGDLMPKRKSFTVKKQRAFVLDYFFAKIETLHHNLGYRLPVFLLMGNDDLSANEPLLIDNQDNYGYVYIHNRIVPFGDYFIAGYSFVPPTPYLYKGWEKFDGTRQAAQRGQYRTKGKFLPDGEFVTPLPDSALPFFRRLKELIFRSQTFIPGAIDPSTSIARDLTALFAQHTAFDRTLFISHAPPYQTSLDRVDRFHHVGSMAIRQFIAEKQPLVSVHGHIHETVEISRQWSTCLPEVTTPMLAVGNNFTEALPHVIVLKLAAPALAAQRIQLHNG